MTISGETIDYGPCAFMDHYDSDTVFSSIDLQGRYAYKNQPSIGLWNLGRFAETLIPLLHENQDEAIQLAEGSLKNFALLYQDAWLREMRSKLGIINEEKQDEMLIAELLGLMKEHQADYTNTFIDLTLGETHGSEFYESDAFKAWYEGWRFRLTRQDQDDHSVLDLMKKSNPVVIPRNHQVEKALQAAINLNDYKPLNSLLEVLENPYNYNEISKEYMSPPDPSAPPYKTYCGT